MIFGQSVTKQALKDYMLIGFAFLTGKPDKKLDKLQHAHGSSQSDLNLKEYHLGLSSYL